MTRPATVPVQLASAGTRTAPPAGVQTTGYVLGDPVPAEEHNYLIGWGIDWARYLADLSPLDGQITANVLQVVADYTVPVVSTTPRLTLDVTGSGIFITAAGTSATMLVANASGAVAVQVPIWQRSGAALGIAPGYPTATTETVDASPGYGDWTLTTDDPANVSFGFAPDFRAVTITWSGVGTPSVTMRRRLYNPSTLIGHASPVATYEDGAMDITITTVTATVAVALLTGSATSTALASVSSTTAAAPLTPGAPVDITGGATLQVSFAPSGSAGTVTIGLTELEIATNRAHGEICR